MNTKDSLERLAYFVKMAQEMPESAMRPAEHPLPTGVFRIGNFIIIDQQEIQRSMNDLEKLLK